MEFLKLDKRELEKILIEPTKNQLLELLNFIYDILTLDEMMAIPEKLKSKKSRNQIAKYTISDLFIKLLKSEDLRTRVYKKLTQTPISKYLYERLVWEKNRILAYEITEKFKLEFRPIETARYGWNEQNLDDELVLITQGCNFGYGDSSEILYINDDIKSILKIFMALPKDYYLSPSPNQIESEYNYNNESEILEFINVISGMLKSNLVEIGKTGDKPLNKTLNILKSSTSIREFFSQKKMDILATDMLTRSFYNYYFTKGFKEDELLSLKEFVKLKFEDRLSFFISRIFASHLKKVRFDDYYTKEIELFDLLKKIINEMPKDEFIEFDNILSYCKYRDYRFDFESRYKTYDYYMDCEILTFDQDVVTDTLYANANYEIIFFEPILKASFFYLASLGLVEIKYSEPVSLYAVTAIGKPYLSVWDGLEEIKLTSLGKYIFDFSKTYTKKELKVQKREVKFDEYKPIITLQNEDALMIAKLDPYTEKYDTNRYILSYSKIFKDCKTYKALEFKIDGFYKNIEKNPPKIFVDFFEDIKKSSNLLKRELKLITIKLHNNKKLLELFMTNKKLQEIIIKAEGHRIVVSKDNLAKLTKIVKENGFFIDF